MAEKDELMKCSKCKCFKFKHFFKIKETNGKILKTCIKCREKYNKKKSKVEAP